MPKKQTTTSEHGEILAGWSFPEYDHPKRSNVWYFFAIAITLALLIYSILSANFLFALIIVLAGIIIVFSSRKEPLTVYLKITEDGLELGESFYSYKDIKNFWIIYEPPEVKNLYFDFNGITKPRLSIPLEKENPVKIRQTLLDYLEEDLTKESEPLSDYLSKTLKL